jgi:hypothetical protein
MRNLYALVIIAATLLGMSSCGKDNNSQNFYRETIFNLYELNYDNVTNKTVAEATFSEGDSAGSRIKLQSGSTVKASNANMSYSEAENNYFISYNGVRSSVSFLYTDKASAKFANNVYLPGSINKGGSFGFLDKSVNNTMFWGGTKVKSGETVTATLGSLTKSTSTVGDSAFVFTSAELTALGIGVKPITVTRRTTTTVVDAPRAGGLIIATYTYRDSSEIF